MEEFGLWMQMATRWNLMRKILRILELTRSAMLSRITGWEEESRCSWLSSLAMRMSRLLVHTILCKPIFRLQLSRSITAT